MGWNRNWLQMHTGQIVVKPVDAYWCNCHEQGCCDNMGYDLDDCGIGKRNTLEASNQLQIRLTRRQGSRGTHARIVRNSCDDADAYRSN